MQFALDDWLPEPSVRTLHRRAAEAGADELWHAAETVRLRDSPVLGRIVRWRIPQTAGDVTFRELFRSYPFTVIAEGERWSVSGLCGRIWTLRREYAHLDGLDDFLAWDEPNTARVLFAHWVERSEGRAEIVSESRIKPVDRRAGVRVTALWTAVGRFERLIGAEALRLAVRRAEEAGSEAERSEAEPRRC
jgi:hypothetical protein